MSATSKSPPTRRDIQRVQTREAIKALAREQMRKDGSAGISLRGIAAELGLTVTALYRYYAGRDDLITALILDGFNAQADALEAARDQHALGDHAGQILAMLLTYRQWALDHAADYQLLYGNPIPGYDAPRELTVPAASRNLTTMVIALLDAHQAGALTLPPEVANPPAQIAAHIASLPPAQGVPPAIVYLGVIGWARIHGMIALEMHGHTPPVVGDAEAFYRAEVVALMRAMGLGPPGG